MNRGDLQRLSAIREAEAKTLLAAGHYAGAYYLMGYAVECALKACIAKQVKEFDFPDKRLAQRVYTHDLKELMRWSGLESVMESELLRGSLVSRNWSVVSEWSEESRYTVDTEKRVDTFMKACGSEGTGILPWIRERW